MTTDDESSQSDEESGGPTRHDPQDLEVLDPQSGQRVPLSVFAAQFSSFSGPLPAPDALEQYERVLPGLAERIVGLTEREERHRQEIERVIVHANERNQTRGQVFAFAITLIVLVGGIILIALGRSVEGLAALLVPLAGIAGVFIYNEVRIRSERRRAQREFADFEQD